MLARLKLTFAEFRRRRVFRVAAAYVVAGWLLIQLGSATFEPMGLPEWSMRLLLVLLALGFVLACVLASAYDLGAHGIERTLPATVARAATTDEHVAAPDASVAVLPFADLSEAHDQGYFCDGLAEEILNALASIKDLRVALRLQPDDFGTLYNAACTYTHMGDNERAIDLLERVDSVGHGFRDWIDHDSDLDSLRGLPRYREIMARLENSGD